MDNQEIIVINYNECFNRQICTTIFESMQWRLSERKCFSEEGPMELDFEKSCMRGVGAGRGNRKSTEKHTHPSLRILSDGNIWPP